MNVRESIVGAIKFCRGIWNINAITRDVPSRVCTVFLGTEFSL